MFKKVYIVLFIGFLFFGCSGVSSGKMTEYRTTVGSTTLFDFQTLSDKMLNQHRFVVDRTEEIGSGSIIETQYEYLAPNNEEALKGIKEVRYNIVLEAQLNGIKTAKANIKCSSVDTACREIIEKQNRTAPSKRLRSDCFTPCI